LTQQHQQLDTRYQSIVRTFPVQTTTPEQLAQTVLLARHLSSQPTHAAALLAAVSQALSAAPDIQLESLGWREGPLTPADSVTIRLDASLTAFDGNYRAAMQRIEDFMQTLQAVPSLHEVRLHTSPVNADSSSSLMGRTLKADATGDSVARFSVELRYREARP
jgi:Tfp pilus assembly protein PilN